MHNPYEAEPAEEPRVCATCARYFDFDRMCNVPEAVEKLLCERSASCSAGLNSPSNLKKSPTAPHG